jgi:hypothetical protein
MKIKALFEVVKRRMLDLANELSRIRSALILNPLGADASRISAILAQKSTLVVQTVFVVTWDVTSAKDVLAEFGNPVHIKVIDYEQLDQINGTADNRVVIFDSLPNAITLVNPSFFMHLKKAGVWVVAVASQGVKPEQVLAFSSVFPEALILKAAFAFMGEEIKYHLHQVKMTPRQDMIYDMRARRYGKAPEIFNMAYPTPLQTSIDANVNPDIGAIIREYKMGLLADAPKLKELITYIILNRDRRHIIHTKYEAYYGVKLLEALLQLNGLDVVTITGSMKTDQRLLEMQRFNADRNPRVLIHNTALPLDTDPLEVRDLHLLDGNLEEGILNLVRIYKYRNYQSSGTPLVFVHNYVTLRSSGAPTEEVQQYTAFQTNEKTRITIWADLNKRSRSLITDRSGRLAVE